MYLLSDEFENSRFFPEGTFGAKRITAIVSFLTYLWFVSNTEPLRTIASRFGVSKASVFRVIRRVIDWTLTKSDETIVWPQGDRIAYNSERFYRQCGIRGIIAAIDGSHIKVLKPLLNPNFYYNRKGWFSLNLQAVLDSSMRFINIYAGEPGSLHDARVRRRSPLSRANEERIRQQLFPNEPFIIGDSAYPLCDWILCPFKNFGDLTEGQRYFNTQLSRARVIVERAFGLLKARFRRIKHFTEYRQMDFAGKLIHFCCILHNICINVGDNWNKHFDDRPNMEVNNEIAEPDFEQRGTNLSDRVMAAMNR